MDQTNVIQEHAEHFPKVERMFDITNRPVYALHALEELAALLHESRSNPQFSAISAGFTYVGQFAAHDMTRMSISDQVANPNTRIDTSSILQLESPSLDLRSLYGGGVLDQTIPYDLQHGKFCSQYQSGNRILDVPRDSGGIATIADPRNDENFMIAQMHSAFMSMHNHLIDLYRDGRQGYSFFGDARRELTLIYQRMLLDFLKTFLDRGVFRALFGRDKLDADRTILQTLRGDQARITLEFAAAAYRFGHSLIRDKYNVTGTKVLSAAEILEVTGKGGHHARIADEALLLEWDLLFSYSDPENDTGTGRSPDTASFVNAELEPALRETLNNGSILA